MKKVYYFLRPDRGYKFGQSMDSSKGLLQYDFSAKKIDVPVSIYTYVNRGLKKNLIIMVLGFLG